jgi:hypothetical protein
MPTKSRQVDDPAREKTRLVIIRENALGDTFLHSGTAPEIREAKASS